MSFLTKILRIFNGNVEQKKVHHEADIKFSALIQNIQKNIIDANQSLECVGIKYIEQFFDKEPAVDKVAEFNNKLDALETELVAGDISAANKVLVDLKGQVNSLTINDEGEVVHYRPRMTSFDFPVLQDGEWRTEVLSIPLFALSPMQVPKITALTFTSKVNHVQHVGDDVYVRFPQKDSHSLWGKKKALNDDNATELKILINPEESSSNLNEVITQYEQVLRSS